MNNKNYWFLGVPIVALLLLILLFRKEVVLVDYGQGQLFITSDFTLNWIHSVEKEPWFEKYRIDEHTLFLEETYFKTFGAGVPSEGTYIESNDGYIHYAIERPVSEVNMMVSTNVQVTVYTQNHTIQLYELVDDYTNVSFSVQRIPLWHYLRGEKYD
ncbi:MAG: DUF1850 domain-containing protein [Solibacillus sp.]